jgi:transcriptional regulator with XRE-family HTH domain
MQKEKSTEIMPSTVAELCLAQSLSFDQLVERSGLEEQRVKAILLRRWTPSPTEREKIAAVFSVPIGEIVWGHATPIQHLYGHGPG